MSIFEGVRVLDCSGGIAGAYATMLLADHGADVVKVEPPEGDRYRLQAGFQTLNRGKRSAVLDLGSEAGRAALSRLARTVDLVVTDRPEVQAAALGLDEATLRAARPDILVLAVTPYGDRGPFADLEESPALLHALSGIAGFQVSRSGDPVALVAPIAAYATGVLAAAAAAAALYARERYGIAQRIEVSGLAGALALQLGAVTSELAPADLEATPPVGPLGAHPAYRAYRASTGDWLFVACGTTRQFHRLLEAVGRPKLVTDPRLAAGPWGTNAPEAFALVSPLLEAAFASESRAHWLEVLRAAGVPAAPVLSRAEFLASEYVGSALASVEHPECRTVRMMGVPLVLDGAPGEVRGRAPLLGEHTAEVLAEADALLEAGDAPRRRARAQGAPPGPGLLAGVRVVDFGSFIAAPAAARHLAMLGASVIKAEQPDGDPFRVLALGFLGWNQGKRSLALNLLSGRPEVMRRLVANNDVVIENYRPTMARRLRVDAHTLRGFNPRVIHVSTTGFDAGTPWADEPAFDGTMQALSGLMWEQGGGAEPVYHTVPVTDLMTPLLSAFGVCAALYHRERTGQGQRVHTSLLRSALAAQAAECTTFEVAPQPRGGVVAGPSATERWYRCSDGAALWVAARTPEQRAALAMAVAGDLETGALAAAFAAAPLEAWLSRLRAAGVPAAPVVLRHALLESEQVRANGLAVEFEHPVWGRTRAPGTLVHASRTPAGELGRAPVLSEHALEVLRELGYSLVEVREFVETGQVVIPELPDESHGEHNYRIARTALLLEEERSRLRYLYSQDVG